MKVAILVCSVSILVLGGCGASQPERQSASDAGAEPVSEKALDCLHRRGKPPVAKPDPPPRRKGLKRLHLTLGGYPDAEDAGVLVAAERGYFAEAGVDLEITSPVIASNLPVYLVDGASDLGLLPQPQVTIARSEGMPLVAIGSVISQPTMGMMSLKGSGIDGIADLEGRTVAIDSLSFEEVALEAALARAGLSLADVDFRRMSHWLVPSLARGRVDAVFGASRNIEGLELEECGVEIVAIPARKLGIPPYEELDVVVRRNRLKEDPQRFHAFMSALARGTAAAIADPRAAAEAISRYRLKLGVASPQVPALVRAKVKATLPLLSTSGSVDHARAARFAAWMRDQGLLAGGTARR